MWWEERSSWKDSPPDKSPLAKKMVSVRRAWNAGADKAKSCDDLRWSLVQPGRTVSVWLGLRIGQEGIGVWTDLGWAVH
jgi:hypothetical protein